MNRIEPKIEVEVWNCNLKQIQNITLSLKDIAFNGSLDKIYRYYNNGDGINGFRLLSIKFIYE